MAFACQGSRFRAAPRRWDLFFFCADIFSWLTRSGFLSANGRLGFGRRVNLLAEFLESGAMCPLLF
jgi:hypothetical protein